MAYWVQEKPKSKKVKQLRRKTVKRPLIRKVGVRNLTDKEAKREGRAPRKKNYVNTTDGAKRKSHTRKSASALKKVVRKVTKKKVTKKK